MGWSTMDVRRLALVAICALQLAGCEAGAPSESPPASAPAPVPTTAATPAATAAATPIGELDRFDQFVRANHPSPFMIHPESEWTAKLAEVKAKLGSITEPDAGIALVSSLVGLLDTHTWITRPNGFHPYPVFLYYFTEGWFVIAALDPTLVGARVVSIGGHPIADVEAAIRPLAPHDNEMGFLLNGQFLFSVSEYLHGAGIVSDPARPSYVLELSDGTTRTEDFAPMPEQAWGESLHQVGMLIGDETEAVRRHTELSWSRIDAKRRVMLITVNDYGDEATVIDALKVALDANQIDRVVLDIRFLPGGNGDFRLLEVLKAEPRVNKPGGLTVLVGRENFSIATAIVRAFDVDTAALLVGEPTPARADNFRCGCQSMDLLDGSITVNIPTHWDNNGDNRPQIDPDVRIDLSAADFFAGRDPVLERALAGISVP